jgi:hypothetical protein
MISPLQSRGRAEPGVGRGDDALAGIEPFEHLDRGRVAAAEPDGPLHRAAAIGRHDEDIGAAGFGIEGAVGDQPRRRRIAQRQPCLQRLAALEIGRLGADEQQVDLELAVLHLRIDLPDLRCIALAVHLDRRALVQLDAAEVEFVDARHQLVAAGRIDLADPLAARQRLADLDVEA